MKSRITIADGQILGGSKLRYLRAFLEGHSEVAFLVDDEGRIEITTDFPCHDSDHIDGCCPEEHA